jgi:hypothetical protein
MPAAASVLVRQQARGPLVRGDAHVLEDERREGEVVFVGVGIEVGAESGGGGSVPEGLTDIDARPRHPRGAEAGAQEFDVRFLVECDLAGVFPDRLCRKSDRSPARDRAARAGSGRIVERQAAPEGGDQVELRFEIL